MKKPQATQLDWKTFYLNHPWFPTRLLIEKLKVRRYDIENWRRHPRVREVLSLETWRLSRTQSPENTWKILAAATKYFLEDVVQIDLEAAEAAKKLIQLKNIPDSGFGFIIDSIYLGKLKGYKAWVDAGFTRTAYVICQIYPGRDYCIRKGILPAMFFQTHAAAVGRIDALALAEHIYLRHLAHLDFNATEEEVQAAKRIFYARSEEHSFLRAKEFHEFGLSTQMARNGFSQMIEALAAKFARDLGLSGFESTGWSSSVFRKKFPGVETTHCRYCQRTPVDLHHCLERSEFPELTYHKENVIPLCVIVHAKITRNQLSEDQQRLYLSAKRTWLSKKDGERLSTFDDVMRELHADVYAE